MSETIVKINLKAGGSGETKTLILKGSSTHIYTSTYTQEEIKSLMAQKYIALSEKRQ